MITIENAVKNFKCLIDKSIKQGGNNAKTAMIRSSRPILNIHEAVKTELVKRKINQQLIFPPMDNRAPELKLSGRLKKKDQDICIVPKNITKNEEVLTEGLLQNVIDEFGKDYTEKTLVINVRSQISSIQKNFDTLFERTYAEAQNLHERCPSIVLGEVYLLAVPEYNESQFKNKQVSFKEIKQDMVEKYIQSFKSITNRQDTTKNFFKYEATCLLIVNFNKEQPVIYNSTDELKRDGLLSNCTNISYEDLDWNNFFKKLIAVYDNRFGIDRLI